jgi:hypothetical protein
MKIGLIGSHGVGKTDITHYLTSIIHRYKSTELIIEVVRPLAKLGFPINENTTFEAQEAILNYQKFQELYAQEQIRQGKIEYAIFDRTVLDNYPYAENKFPEESRRILYPQVIDWINRYPYYKLFKLPVWKEEIEEDGTRSTEKEFQLEIDSRLTLLLKRLDIPYEDIPKEFFLQDDEMQAITFIRYFKKILNYK